VRRKLQDIFDYSINSGSRKPNSSPPILSSFAVKIVSYSSITTPTPAPPVESINAIVLPYSWKGYIITDRYSYNLIPDILPAYPNNLIPIILPVYTAYEDGPN
jgi:hypothetical protein